MKKFLITAGVMLAIAANGQTLEECIKKTRNENFEQAAAGFRSLIEKEPAKGEYYFYFGENYYRDGDADSANIFYAKGVEVNATNPLNYVGLGKVLLAKGKVDEAKAQFYKATSIAAGKNAEVLRRIAEAWLIAEQKNPDEALTLLNAAIKLEPKNPENYILLGDAQLEKNPTDGSVPVKSYQTATTLNPKSSRGLLRTGKVYQRSRNYPLALDYYKQAQALDPTFAPAYREIAELYSLSGQPAKSIENWKKYLELNNSLQARYRFMSALFSNSQFADAVKEYEDLKKNNFNNLYLERIAGYSYEEMGDKTDKEAYKKGLTAIQKFFEGAGQNFKYIARDYKYRGILLIRNGQDSLGMIDIQKAISMDSTIAGETYAKLARFAMDNKQYAKAIMYFEKKRNGDYKNLGVAERFDLGKAYYQTGQARQKEVNELKDALAKKKKPLTPEVTAKQLGSDSMFVQADSAFKRVLQSNPGYILGYVYRGRVNNYLDPEVKSDSTKTYYEKVLQMVKPEERTTTYRNYLIEAYEYLGYFYIRRKDNDKAKQMFTELKELDPANEKVKVFFAPPKQAAPKPKGK